MADQLDESERRFQMLVEAVQDYAIYMIDPAGFITTWNPGAERSKGYTSAEILGASFERFFPAEAIAAGTPRKILETAATTGSFKGEGWRIRKDGSLFWASVVVTAIRDTEENLIGFAKVTRDLTERKQYEEALLLERDRLSITLHSIADGVICTDGLGIIDLMNPAAEAMTGWSSGEAVQHPIEDVFRLVDPTTKADIANPIRLCLASRRPCYLHEEANLIAKDGREFGIQDSAAPIRSREGVIGAVLVFQDVTRLRAAQSELVFQATHDSLTLLPNRKHFVANLELAIQQVAMTGGEQTLAFLDLDGFKVINDNAGHAAGDAFLQSIGALLRQSLRSSDTVARHGGDEFAILLGGCRPVQAEDILRKLLRAIELNTFKWQGRCYSLSASIGVVAIRPGAEVEALMREADAACYAAKRSGGKRICLSPPPGTIDSRG